MNKDYGILNDFVENTPTTNSQKTGNYGVLNDFVTETTPAKETPVLTPALTGETVTPPPVVENPSSFSKFFAHFKQDSASFGADFITTMAGMASIPRDVLIYGTKAVKSFAGGVQKGLDNQKPLSDPNWGKRIEGDVNTPTTQFYQDIIDELGKGKVDQSQWDTKIQTKAKEYGNKLQEKAGVDPYNRTFEQNLAGGFGSMAGFFVPSYGAARFAQFAVKTKKAADAYRIVGGTSMVVNESLMEANQVFQDEYARTGNVQEAQAKADNTVIANMLLIGITNHFSKYFEYTAPGFRNLMKGVVSTAISEGSQEAGQQVISNINTGRPIFEGVKDSALIGAIVGGVTHVGTRSLAPPEVGTVIQPPKGGTGEEEKKKPLMERLKEKIFSENKGNPVVDEYAKNDKILTDTLNYIKSTKEVETPEQVLEKLVQAGIDRETAVGLINEGVLREISSQDVASTPEQIQEEIISDNVRKAIESGARETAISKAIQDQYEVTPEYADQIVAKVKAENEAVDTTDTEEDSIYADYNDELADAELQAEADQDWENDPAYADRVAELNQKVTDLTNTLNETKDKAEKAKIQAKIDKIEESILKINEDFREKWSKKAEALKAKKEKTNQPKQKSGGKDIKYDMTPTFEPAEFRDEDTEGGEHTIVAVGDYVVDTDGKVFEVISGNDTEKDEWQRGYLRLRQIGDKEDYMGYANQVRKATDEEIAIAKKYEKENPPVSTRKGTSKKEVAEEEAKRVKKLKNLSKEDKKEIEKYYGYFKSMFELRDKVIEEEGEERTFNEDELALEELLKVEENLTEKQQKFLVDNIMYMPPNAVESIENFTEYISKNDMLDVILSGISNEPYTAIEHQADKAKELAKKQQEKTKEENRKVAEKEKSLEADAPKGWTATALNTIWTKDTNSLKNGYINIYALDDNGENKGTFRISVNDKMVKEKGKDKLFHSLADAIKEAETIDATPANAPKTLKVVISNNFGKPQIKEVEVLGTGTIAGYDVFVHDLIDGNGNRIATGVTEYGTGYSVGTSEYKSAKRAIADVEKQLIEKGGSVKEVAKAFASGISSKKNINGSITDLDNVDDSSTIKGNDKTIQRDTRNKRRKAPKSISDSTGATGEVGGAPTGTSEDKLQDGGTDTGTVADGKKSNGNGLVAEVDTEANPQAETDYTTNVKPVVTAIETEVAGLEKELETAPDEVKPEIEDAIETAEEEKAKVENDFLDKYEAVTVTNEEIAQIVSNFTTTDSKTGEVTIKQGINPEEFVAAVMLVQQYKSGGTAKEGRGILDEYYTDKQIVSSVLSLLDIAESAKVLEPSVGIGNFIPTGVENVDGYEINAVTAGIAKMLNPKAKIFNTSFETNFIDEKGNKKEFKQKYDLVIGNPPYGEHRGLYKGLGEEESIAKYEDYFTKRGLDVVKEGGKVVFVIPSSFLKTQTSKAKQEIAKIGVIDLALRLPENAFEGTSIGTDIVVFTKATANEKDSLGRLAIEQRLQDMTNDKYFTDHPDGVLGETLERKNRFGKQETYVEGTVEDALAKLNSLNLYKIAVGVAKKAGIEATEENIDAIEEVLDESSTNDVTDLVEEEIKENTEAEKKQKAKEEERSKKIIEKIRVASKNKNVKQIRLLDYQDRKFTENEIEHWYNREQDGSIREGFKHDPKLTSYYKGKWYMDFSYLQGNIYEKLEDLEKDKKDMDKSQYEKQKKALEAIKPEIVPLERINISANSNFLKDFYIKKASRYGDDIVEVNLAQDFMDFVSDAPYGALGNMGRSDIYGYVYNEAVRGGSKDENARARKYRVIVANELLKKYFEEMRTERPELAKRFELEYNKQKNGTHNPDYGDVPLTITINNSLNGETFELTPVQIQGIARLVEKGVGMLAHDVGFGKTLSAILAVYQNMEYGHTKKPLIVVPKATYTQWINTILEVIPNAKVNSLYNLADGYKGDLSKLEIKEGEFNIVTEEGFKQLSFKEETYDKFAGKYNYASDDLTTMKSKREAEKNRAEVERNKGKMIKGSRKDLIFEDLGFDHVVIDEVQNANNIITKIKMPKDKATEFRAVSKPAAPSQYGIKVWLASQYIQEKNGGKNVYTLSATPFTNNPLQYFSILSLLANPRMSSMGVDNVNDFFGMFMETRYKLEYKANQTFNERQIIDRFKNNTLLQKLLREYIDFKDGEDNPNLIRPEKHQRVNNFSKSQDYINNEKTLLKDFKPEETLKFIGQLRALAISSSLLKGTEPSISDYKSIVEDSPKLYAIAKNIINNQKLNKKNGREATEIVYTPIGVEILPILKQYLIKEGGLKPEEIAIITGDPKYTPEKRAEIQEEFNKKGGKIKVLLGTDTIGTGLNLQKRTSDIHFLGLPYNFTDLIQVEGRAWRQGNKWRNVRMNHYLMENSYDALHFQILTSKQKRYELAIKNNEDEIDVGDVDAEKQLADLITDPNLIAQLKYNEAKETLAESLRVANAELSYSQKKIDKITKREEEITTTQKSIERAKQQLADKDVSEYMRNYYEELIIQNEKRVATLKKEIDEQKQKYIENGIDIKALYAKIDPLKKEVETISQKLSAIDTIESKNQFLEDAKKSVKPVVPFALTDVQTVLDAYAKENETFYQLETRKPKSAQKPVEQVEIVEEKQTLPTSNKVYYHGTLETFDAFDIKKAGKNTGWDNAKFGFFFTEHKDRAAEFIETTRQPGDNRKGVVKEVYLDIKKPIDLTIQGIFNNEDQAPTVVKLLSGEIMKDKKEALEYLNENIDLGDLGDMQEQIYGDIANKKLLQKAGYDGIISEFGQDDNGNVIKEYVAFEASQIKNVEKKAKPVAKKVAKKTTSVVSPELAIINDKSISVDEKVEKLLDRRQEGKEYKDVGNRVAGSRKEKATIKTIYKYGGQDLFDAMVNSLGWEAVLETVDKAEILQETGADKTVQSDFDDKVPVNIAQKKKDLIDSIYRVPKLAGKKKGKWSYDHFSYVLEPYVKENEYRRATSANKEELIAIAKIYPTILKQIVNRILSVKTDAKPMEIIDDNYVYIDALGNIVEEKSPNAKYKIEMEAFGFSGKWSSRPAYMLKRAFENTYEKHTFDEIDYEKLLNPVAKERNVSDDKHGNFDDIEKYDVGDEQVAKERVKAETLTTEYGFKSVQLGNYMDDQSSYEHIQQTIGALDSMKKALGIDLVKIISERGLSMAYGARGGTKAVAHYEPTANIINITKKRGDGSFGHEFMHFLDFTAKTGKGTRLSGLFNRAARRYYRDDSAGMLLMQALETGGYEVTKTFKPNEEKLNDLLRFDYSRSEEEMLEKGISIGDIAAFIIEEYKKDPNIVGKKVNYLNDGGLTMGYGGSVTRPITAQLLANLTGKEVVGKVPVYKSTFRDNAVMKLGGGNSNSYWAKREELLARAFEAYLFDKMEATGNKNAYAVRDNVAQTEDSWLALAYPQGEERAAFNKLFDRYFSTLKEKYPLYKNEADLKKVQRMQEIDNEVVSLKKQREDTEWNSPERNAFDRQISILTTERKTLELELREAPKFKYKGEVLRGSNDSATRAFLQDVKDRLKADFDVQYFDTILGQSGEQAFGATKDNIVSIEKGAPFVTAPHEIVHLTINNLSRIGALAHLNREDILREQAKKMGLPEQLYELADVEEALALGVEKYRVGQMAYSPTSKIKQFYDFIIDQFKKLARAIGLSERSIIEDYYDALLFGNTVSDEYVDLDNGRDLAEYIMGSTLNFSIKPERVLTLNSRGVMLKEKLDEALADYDALVNEVKSNQEIMGVIANYTSKASLDEIVQGANEQVAEYVKAILEIKHIKEETDDATETFLRLVKNREHIEDIQKDLEKKLVRITRKTKTARKRVTTPSVDAVADAVATEVNSEAGDTTWTDTADKGAIPGETTLAILGDPENPLARIVDIEDEEGVMVIRRDGTFLINPDTISALGGANGIFPDVESAKRAFEKEQETEKQNTPAKLVKRMTPVSKTQGTQKVSTFQSRMLSLLEEQNREDVMYDVMTKVEEVAKAEAYYDKNKKRTINMALGKEPVPEGISSNVIALTVIQKAKEAGDSKTIARVLPKLSIRATKQGQEIAMLADAFGERDPISYMNKLIAQRKLLAKKKYKPLFTSLDDAKGFEKLVEDKVKEARKRAPKLSDIMLMKAEDIDNFLNDITC